MNSDPLPTSIQGTLLCHMIHCAFVELRLLGQENRGAQTEDLADAFHNIADEMNGRGQFSWEIFRGMLQVYQRKWRTQITFDYVAMLDEIRGAV